ncbi:integral membrane protein [Talaromyces pinophilus]|uniref:Integral membrane protein n=1 Tax=Talaromyces pinophilus TaxID=128442 RepID=A0A6V8H9W9_TALPI|nr:integral membrane protein [Talaromyces pinophilus]
MSSAQSGTRPDTNANPQQSGAETQVEVDDFGLPIRPKKERNSSENSNPASPVFHDAAEAPASTSTDDIPPQGQDLPAPTSSHAETNKEINKGEDGSERDEVPAAAPLTGLGVTIESHSDSESQDNKDTVDEPPVQRQSTDAKRTHAKHDSTGASEWSHQKLTEQHSDEESDGEGDWKAMPALGEMDHYDDYGRLVAKGSKIDDDDYMTSGAVSRGYTRVQFDDDVHSVTSMDEDTSYLFKESHGTSAGIDDDTRDPLSQLQATKDLLSESQRIAYVGVVRLAIYQMTSDMEKIPTTKSSKKALQEAVDSMKKWSQGVMIRLFAHMDIDSAEQVMIEQLAEHGVQAADLVDPLMKNSRVKNPMAEEGRSSLGTPSLNSPSLASEKRNNSPPLNSSPPAYEETQSPPPYGTDADEVPAVQTPSQMPKSANIEIDLRWTVLCDLFLVLISEANYDARSRYLLEQVGEAMKISWMQICRFEKKVIDALEMEQAAEKETWDESEHMEQRRKKALKSKYVIMGLATVGGGLVIGLSAGLLAPVIGAGLAAGFTTIGISGTGAFLGGAGGTALIASGATLTGTYSGLRASHRRTGAVQTFEYRPLHNNQRVNLIVTVSGWMTGKVDDVRLPFSTVDPIMGDLYSVFWEPEMLQSMGSTINILATEALTQGLQQVLGSTILTALMGALQLPIVLTKLAYLIDNPWNVSLVRANAAGLILADSIMSRNLGKRPITLLGFSLGSRVIFSCLKELAKQGAYGLVQNVYMFGSPIVANKDEYLKVRSVVVGRFVNGYSSNDWILGYLFRATSGGIMRVAGLAPVLDIPGMENFDVTNLVSGHMNYRAAMPRLLREVGWEVLSDEFAEIEDPDPENHAERQRELIREIDEARREAEQKPDKKRFGLFKKSTLAKKKGWETYDPDQPGPVPHPDSPNSSSGRDSVLFDIDAIRAELASEQIEVKQLESTLPPIKLDLNNYSADRPELRPSKSENDAPTLADSLPTTTKDTLEIPSTAPTSSNSNTKHDDFPNKHDYEPEEEDVQLTFDTAYHNPSTITTTSLGTSTFDNEYNYNNNSNNRLHDQDISSASRPPLHSAATMPVDFGHNAWAEGANHEEGDIHMTFE